MKARYLKRAVVNQLWDNVQTSLPAYRTGDFSHLLADATAYFEGEFEVVESKLAQISVGGSSLAEAGSCKLIVEAMPDLSPYEARDERFWVYLTHTLLLDYSRARWPLPQDDDKAVAVIRRHYFARGQRGIEVHNAASRLWWMGHLCGRVKDVSFEDALQTFLLRSDVRANIIERPTVSQNAQIFSAIIKVLRASAITDKALLHRDLFRPFMRRLNSIGGARLLDSMSEPQVSELLSGILQAQLVQASKEKMKRANQQPVAKSSLSVKTSANSAATKVPPARAKTPF